MEPLDEDKQKPRIIPIVHQERRSILFYSIMFFCYGFFIDFKPSEPFLVPYLIKVKGFTNNQIEEDIFPLWTYAYFVAVVLCGLLSEVFQYKPIIVLGSLARVATRVILIMGTTMIAMQATQFTFGLASGTEVIFYAYVYYLVPYSQYQKLTGITRASVLVGHVGANFLGQLLITKFNAPLILLFYISLAAICIATVISVFFPSVTIELKSCSQNFGGMKSAFLDLVANKEILPWTAWFILAMATNDMILNYATTLFYDVDPNVDWNGLVMAIVRLAGALGAIVPAVHWVDGRLESSRKTVVVVVTMIAGVSMIATTFVNIWIIYGLLVLYMGALMSGISIASAQIAKSMSTRKYALVFSVITIIYLGIETLFQFIIGPAVLSLSSRVMFCVFGSTLVLATFIFLLVCFVLRDRSPAYSRISTEESSNLIN